MKIIFLVLLITFSFSSFASKVCALNFERPKHYTSKMVSKTFDANPSTKVVLLAKPVDILKCVQEGYSEIIIIAHSLYNPKTPDKDAKFGYYAEKTIGQYKALLEEIKSLKDLYSKTKRLKRYVSDGREIFKKNRSQRRFERLTEVEAKINNGHKLYDFKKFHPVIFKNLKKMLQKEYAETGDTRLKSIRIASCTEDSLKKRYQILNEISDQFAIKFDWQPENKFSSWLKDIQTTVLDENWLRESL